jgi:hypothetical protein
LATPIKLNKPVNELITKAMPEFRFKKKGLTSEIKLKFEDSDEFD